MISPFKLTAPSKPLFLNVNRPIAIYTRIVITDKVSKVRLHSKCDIYELQQYSLHKLQVK